MNQSDYKFKRKPAIERLVLFALSLVFWIMLIWPVTSVDGRLLTGDIAVGIVVAAFVALIMHNIIRVRFVRLVNPVSWFWAFVYLFVLSYYVIKGGVDVSYRVLHPRMPIRPGIVRIRSILETDTGRAVLANCITLTPGTLTIDVTDDGVFYIHWLNVLSLEEEEVAKQVLRRFEWYIKRIFE
ncbi:MAG: Na+/H+ antiporter subunit E [Xanthomonadales bacterium]|nr:Na+/H+ antiporter subunit E [Xanthomonadales bacterium]